MCDAKILWCETFKIIAMSKIQNWKNRGMKKMFNCGRRHKFDKINFENIDNYEKMKIRADKMRISKMGGHKKQNIRMSIIIILIRSNSIIPVTGLTFTQIAKNDTFL
jgi:hypothetical protein